MLIGLLIAVLFGGGSIDYFYIEKIELGIKKAVVDKDRRKDLQTEIKAHTKSVDDFNKIRKGSLKELKNRNLDKNTPLEWYQEFFEQRIEERIKLQKSSIDSRIVLQEKITGEEWDAIMKIATNAETKEAAKEQRKDLKNSDKNNFRQQETAIIENVADQDKRMVLLAALEVYEAVYDQIHESYENINVNESQFLLNKNLTREEMLKLAMNLNDQRKLLYQGYAVFAIAAERNTNDEEYKSIMKSFNKFLK